MTSSEAPTQAQLDFLWDLANSRLVLHDLRSLQEVAPVINKHFDTNVSDLRQLTRTQVSHIIDALKARPQIYDNLTHQPISPQRYG